MPGPEKLKPVCPLCEGKKHRREVVRVYDEKAMQKRALTLLTCTKCSHALLFNGLSNLFDLG
jgi:ribosomal protein L37AE/L43A